MNHLNSLNEGQREAVLMRNNGVCSAGAGAGKTHVLSMRFLDLLAPGPEAEPHAGRGPDVEPGPEPHSGPGPDTATGSCMTSGPDGEPGSMQGPAAVSAPGPLSGPATGSPRQSATGQAGIEIDRILTLTFTRKASLEMLVRIYQTLLRGRADDPRIETAFRGFDRAVITTLDSFCMKIAQAGCARYGMPRPLSVDETRLSALASRRIKAFIGANRDNACFADFCRAFGLKEVCEQVLVPIAAELACPVDLVSPISAGFEAGIATMRAAEHRYAERCVRSAGRALVLLDRFFALRADFGNKPTALQREAHDFIAALAARDPEVFLAAAEEDPEILDVPFPRKPSVKEDAELNAELKWAWDAAKAEIRALRGCLSFFLDLDRGRELAAVLEGFRQDIIAVKRSSGLVTYRDLNLLAVQTLIDDPALADYYRERFRAVMIDEFQDNNALQKNLLYLIAAPAGYREPRVPRPDELRPDVLFFVGDQKQSIYRFRGADVEVFKRLAGELSGGSTRGESSGRVRLLHNYRSHPRLVGYFNALFARVFALQPGHPAEYRRFEAEFDPILPRDPSPGEPDPIVECWIQPYDGNPGGFLAPDGVSDEAPGDRATAGDGSAAGDKAAARGIQAAGITSTTDAADPRTPPLGAAETEFRALARRIRRLLDEQTPVWDREARAARPVREEDIGILMRTGSRQMDLERMLRLYGISYRTDADRSMFLDSLAADFTAFIAVLLYPHDAESWLVLAGSPFLNLGNAGTAELTAFAVSKPGVRQAGAAGIEDFDGFSDPQDAERWRRFAGLYRRAKSLADRVGHSALCDLLWDEGGYRHFAARAPSPLGFVDQYEQFRAFADSFADEPLARFLRELRGSLGKFEKKDDLAVVQPFRPGVRIMSVHKSKGLEFPVVFVANIGGGSAAERGKTSPGVVVSGPDAVPILLLNHRFADGTKHDNLLFTLEQEERAFAEWAELKRLFYVAATRAENHLFFFGSYGRQTAKDLFEGVSATSAQESADRRADQSADHAAAQSADRRADQSADHAGAQYPGCSAGVSADEYEGAEPKPVKHFLGVLMSAYYDRLDPLLRAAEPRDPYALLSSAGSFPDGLSVFPIVCPTEREWDEERRALHIRMRAFETARPDSADGAVRATPKSWQPEPVVLFASDHDGVTFRSVELADTAAFARPGTELEVQTPESARPGTGPGAAGTELGPTGTEPRDSAAVDSREVDTDIDTDPDPERSRFIGTLAHWLIEAQIAQAAAATTASEASGRSAPPQRPAQKNAAVSGAVLPLDIGEPPPVPRGIWAFLPGQIGRALARIRRPTDAAEEAWRLARGFFSSRIAEIVRTAPGCRMCTELPVLFYRDPVWVSGTIDLLVEFPASGERWVIDFKTDHAADPERYRDQLSWYAQAARDVFLGSVEVGCGGVQASAERRPGSAPAECGSDASSEPGGRRPAGVPIGVRMWTVRCFLVWLRTGAVDEMIV